MIIGFLGKGGSGKSTLSAKYAQFLNGNGKSVLAIDADHNMDLGYNLGTHENTDMKYFGASFKDMLEYLKLPEDTGYADAFLSAQKNFSLSPVDDFTENYSNKTPQGIRLLTAGPQTNDVLFGKNCSHSLTSPLKVYLPLLEIQEHEYVVVDEKAGADGASTGIVTGFDYAFIISEPTPHGIKTAHQIAELLDFFEVPFSFVLNKKTDAGIPEKYNPEYIFEYEQIQTEKTSLMLKKMFEDLEVKRNHISGKRKERTMKKFLQNKEFLRL